MCVERKIIQAFALYVIRTADLVVFVIGDGPPDHHVVRIEIRIDIVAGNRRRCGRWGEHLWLCSLTQFFQFVFVKRFVGRNHVQYGQIWFELFETDNW